jgi:ABC-type transport system involved in multi-copper enzyme maturation permease subunit
VARERELGTFDQLLVSPMRPFEIVVGKLTPAVLAGLFHGTVGVLAAHFVFRVPLTGSVPLLYVAMLLYLLAISGVGLFISSLAATQQQAILGVFMFTAPAVLRFGFASRSRTSRIGCAGLPTSIRRAGSWWWRAASSCRILTPPLSQRIRGLSCPSPP